MRILLIGFPKSGTCSFQALFQKLGFESYHQMYHGTPIARIIQQNLENQKPLLEGFPQGKDVDMALTQLDYCHEDLAFWPQLSHFPQLYHENKDAYFILNKRNPDDLLRSFQRWYGLDKRILRLNPELFHQATSDNDDEKLLTLFRQHYEKVESFFEALPDARFLTFDITTGNKKENIDKLLTFLRLENLKDMEFPHENKNPL